MSYSLGCCESVASVFALFLPVGNGCCVSWRMFWFAFADWHQHGRGGQWATGAGAWGRARQGPSFSGVVPSSSATGSAVSGGSGQRREAAWGGFVRNVGMSRSRTQTAMRTGTRTLTQTCQEVRKVKPLGRTVQVTSGSTQQQQMPLVNGVCQPIWRNIGGRWLVKN